MDRIQINGVWYVKEDTINQPTIEIDPANYDGCSVENDDFAFEATRTLNDKNIPYPDAVSIEVTDKRFSERKDWKTDYWDNNDWMRKILENDPEAHKDLPDFGRSTNYQLFLKFLEYLKNKNWL